MVRHEVDFELWKVLGSESLETVSDVLSLWKLITSSLIDVKAISITVKAAMDYIEEILEW